MLNAFPKPMLFAHRGASAYAPENTLAAFELAVQLFKSQPPAIELDAKLSRDGKVFVFHDLTVDRTTNGKGKTADFALQELQELDAGSYFNQSFSGEKIPTLESVFETVGGKAFINVELTNYATPRDGLNEHIAELVTKHNLTKSVIFSSFLPGNLRKMARLLPDVPRALLTYHGIIGLIQRNVLVELMTSYQALNPDFRDTTLALVDSAHRKDRRVNVYTVNDPKEIRRLAEIGVDGIFTDDVLTSESVLIDYRKEHL
jgi:glycerophosphoryl diester phosphodiesterase